MSYTLSPTTLTMILEETNFSRTVTITAGASPPITSIVVTKSDNTNGNIVITTDNSSSFTISGTYSNNFSKTVSYLDANKQPQTIASKTALSNLPDGYFLVTEYLASTETIITASYSVAVNGSVIGTVTQQINNNYTPGQDALIAAVAGGQV